MIFDFTFRFDHRHNRKLLPIIPSGRYRNGNGRGHCLFYIVFEKSQNRTVTKNTLYNK